MKRKDEYCTSRTVLMAEVSVGRVRGRPRLGWMDAWCEGFLGQQRNDGGGCASVREGSDRVESPGPYVTE